MNSWEKLYNRMEQCIFDGVCRSARGQGPLLPLRRIWSDVDDTINSRVFDRLQFLEVEETGAWDAD